jgi:hypothetical protein
MKGCPAALDFEARVIAAVKIEPQAEKNGRHQEAVNDGARGEIEHAANLAGTTNFATRNRGRIAAKKSAPKFPSARSKNLGRTRDQLFVSGAASADLAGASSAEAASGAAFLPFFAFAGLRLFDFL